MEYIDCVNVCIATDDALQIKSRNGMSIGGKIKYGNAGIRKDDKVTLLNEKGELLKQRQNQNLINIFHPINTQS